VRRAFEIAGGLFLAVFSTLILVASFAEYQKEELFVWLAREWLVGCAASLLGIVAGIFIVVRGSGNGRFPWSR
jgi:hypothetical protein